MYQFHYFRYAYNYILALSETLKILESEDDKPAQQSENIPAATQHNISSAYHPTTTDYQQHTAAYKPEPTWQYNTAPSCLQYSPSPAASNPDSYDYYSEVSSSPQSNMSNNDWNQAIDDDIPLCNSNLFVQQQFQPYHHIPSPQPMLRMPEITSALSHCHWSLRLSCFLVSIFDNQSKERVHCVCEKVQYVVIMRLNYHHAIVIV